MALGPHHRRQARTIALLFDLFTRKQNRKSAAPAPDLDVQAVVMEAPPLVGELLPSEMPAAVVPPAGEPIELTAGLVKGSHLGVITPGQDGVRVDGGAAPWAYAGFAPFTFTGRALVQVDLTPLAGTVGVSVMKIERDDVLHEQEIAAGAGRRTIRIAMEDAAQFAGVVLRTVADIAVAPSALVHKITIEPMPFLDPFLESLWPMKGVEHSLPALYGWSHEELQASLTGDKWLDNAMTNKWEFVKGVAKLTSFPTRFSVPFVLCNARCEFCSAWLANAEPMPVDLIDGVAEALPYLSEIDLVGWGEPLIHPQLDGILAKLRDYCDPRARISLTTNGVHLKKWAPKLLEAGVSDISISIHAARPETHEDLMGLAKGSFAKVVEGMEAIAAYRAEGHKVRLSMTFIVTRQNVDEIPEFIALGERLGVDQLFFRTLKPQTMNEEDMQGLDYQRLPPYLHEDFEGARTRAIAALATAKVHCDVDPAAWSAPIFPKETEAEILARPLTLREVRRRDKSLRYDPIPDSPDLPKGEILVLERTAVVDDTLRPAPEADPEDDGANPYGRAAPYRCPSPYTALYLSGFNRKVTPCCYMTHVPGYQPAYLRTGVDFSALWNSPAMTELRRSLDEGDLKSPCKKCPFYW
jgi:molybdenum cofactor biosynthesis enzyme MoaA